MEHLTKQQIILLAFLVSFVSSIATGIVTVSLMDQAAPSVSQTINRVVERTIEKASPTSTTKETIIVKEDQATVDAIAKASKGIVRIMKDGTPVLLGIIVSESGKILAYDEVGYGDGLSVSFQGGNTVPLAFISRDSVRSISVFQAEQSSDPKDVRAYGRVALADEASLKLGQSIVALSGAGELAVATGIISSINAERIRTITSGGAVDSPPILVNLLGEVVGVKDTPSNILKTYATP